MKIRFHKLSDEEHVLELVRAGGDSERLTCETRSLLVHDLLHYAAESQAGYQDGFWGQLARGRTLAELDARTGEAMPPDMQMIEQAVGVLHGAVKGRPADEIAAGLADYAAATGVPAPSWLTADFVAAVQESIRRLLGRWRATPFGGTMELTWSDP